MLPPSDFTIISGVLHAIALLLGFATVRLVVTLARSPAWLPGFRMPPWSDR